MPTLLSPNVWTEITREAGKAKKPADVAVAYFGKNGPSLLPLPPGSRLVVDASIATVSAGSTHPPSLETLRSSGVQVYSAQNLHAKVYAFDKVGFVGSPNASLNSSSSLIEAVLRTTEKRSLESIRDFVTSVALTKLSKADIIDLSKIYRPPKRNILPHDQAKFSTLLMELTNEQGGRRASQVQPPRPVWLHYFGIDVETVASLPSLKLNNLRHLGGSTTVRPIIKHHHVYTIEISGAELPRPAILKLRRIGQLEYSYVVYRPNDPEFNSLNNLLKTIANPLRTSGRLWLMV